jgi:hypothetical protein
MKTFNVYRHPVKGNAAVKSGFSWPGFFITYIWAFFKGLVGIGLLLLLPYILTSVLVATNLPGLVYLLGFVVFLVVALVVGFKGNEWRMNSLAKRGYELVETLQAESADAAITNSLRRKGVPTKGPEFRRDIVASPDAEAFPSRLSGPRLKAIDDQIVLLMRDTIVAAGESGGLDLIENLRSIYNSNFSKDQIRIALEHPRSSVRTRTEKFLRDVAKLFPEERPTEQPKRKEQSITVWAKNEQTASQLSNDQYFLYGLLRADGSDAAREFLDALGQGGTLSHDVFPNPGKGGYDVKITLRS